MTTTKFNNNVADMVQLRIDAGDNLLHLVDMEVDAGLNYHLTTDNPPRDMADNLHLSHTGYARMADKWFVDGLLAILPTADAGADQNVDEKTLVTLDGSLSVDPDQPAGDPLLYSWEQGSGPEVSISDPTVSKPTFTAPEVTASGNRLGFKLTVTDVDGFEHSDTVFVDIGNVFIDPVANAGPDQIVPENKMVTLNGSGSQDPDGMITSVEWEQISGNTQAALTSPQELVTDFVAPEVGSEGDAQVFKLTIKDNDDLVSEDTVTVTITPPVTVSPTSVSSGGGGSGGGGCFIQSVMN